MRGFCFADFDQVGDCLFGEAEGLEVGGWEAGEALLVEGGFEVFGCQSTINSLISISVYFLILYLEAVVVVHR